jgi:hypothetical protein
MRLSVKGVFEMISTQRRFERLEKLKLVRFRVVPDTHFDCEDLKGDMFNTTRNTDIDPEVLAQEEKAFEERVYYDGVWGIVTEYSEGGLWTFADSVWGFVGNDWQGSGYDEDLKKSAIIALRDYLHTRCRCCYGKGRV